MYFTRLTPNFNNWKQPSGRDGKCKSSNPKKPLYEETNGFGWEEWLFEQYHIHKHESEFECNGFIEAFNKQNQKIDKVKRLYLYTKLCNNTKGIMPGNYYVGYIDNVSPIKNIAKTNEEVHNTLTNVGIMHDGYIPMLPFALNISFKVKDVHVDFEGVFKRPIRLERGQFRFSLYDMNKHTNFIVAISKYTNQ